MKLREKILIVILTLAIVIFARSCAYPQDLMSRERIKPVSFNSIEETIRNYITRVIPSVTITSIHTRYLDKNYSKTYVFGYVTEKPYKELAILFIVKNDTEIIKVKAYKQGKFWGK